jgi:P-loop containing dynein motor region D4
VYLFPSVGSLCKTFASMRLVWTFAATVIGFETRAGQKRGRRASMHHARINPPGGGIAGRRPAIHPSMQVEISKSHGSVEWCEDLKGMLRRAGGENAESVLLLTDTQIKDKAFFEDVNGISKAGEVPNLFPADERVQVRK